MALLQLLHVHQQLTGQHRYACGAAAEREEGCVLFDTDSFHITACGLYHSDGAVTDTNGPNDINSNALQGNIRHLRLMQETGFEAGADMMPSHDLMGKGWEAGSVLQPSN